MPALRRNSGVEPGSKKCTGFNHDQAAIHCLAYGVKCPTSAQARTAFDHLEAELREHAPPSRLLVLNMSEGDGPGGFQSAAVARFLGRPLPARYARSKGIPKNDKFFCHHVRAPEKKRPPSPE